MRQARWTMEGLTDDALHRVLDDRSPDLDPAAVRRVLLTTGKLAHELMDGRDQAGSPVAVGRIEQLYPWPEPELLAALARYPNTAQLWWVQEEPANMGAWSFVDGALRRSLGATRHWDHIARHASASPATGSPTVHEREQQAGLDAPQAGFRAPAR